MKNLFSALILSIFVSSCSEKNEVHKSTSSMIGDIVSASENQINEGDEKLLDNDYICENDAFISVLEELPNEESNAYRIKITSKDGKKEFIKVLDTRPRMSKIVECNSTYTVVGFPCGGPCYSQVFVFTDENKPIEQFDYVQRVEGNDNIIAHIKDEEFEKLIVHNLLNGRELIVDISDRYLLNYSQMDSLILKKDKLILYYEAVDKQYKTKIVDLKSLLQ